MINKSYIITALILIVLFVLYTCDLGKDRDPIAGYEEVLAPDYSEELTLAVGKIRKKCGFEPQKIQNKAIQAEGDVNSHRIHKEAFNETQST